MGYRYGISQPQSGNAPLGLWTKRFRTSYFSFRLFVQLDRPWC